MKTLLNALICSTLLATSMVMQADTLELADGTLLEGDFVGSSNGIIMFNTGEQIEAYPEADIVGIFLSEGVANRSRQQEEPSVLTVPAGTRLVIRTTDYIDSSRHGVGHRFRGQLESAIPVNGQTVIPRGTMVHGRITQASQSGRLAGSTSLAIEFTDIMLDDQLFPIRTSDLKAQGANEAGRTVGRTARAAAIGGLIDGKSGARTGAKVGAGTSLITRGATISVPRGTILETRLDAPLTIPGD